ncbi:HEAT repeat domain-containing protein [Streptomyces sp. NPDC020480]|uniref:HEAT repeat domain-containing protein n=1 Tax=Streptomyces sp. NPDC020480 TaxID=3365076 RepID=UPI0037AAA569
MTATDGDDGGDAVQTAGSAVEVESLAFADDFEFDLDTPGEASGEALDLLLADLAGDLAGAPVERPCEWLDALALALEHGVDAVLRRVAHADPRIGRIAAHVLAYARLDEAALAALLPRLLACFDRVEDETVRAALLLVISRAAGTAATADDPAARVLREWLTAADRPGLRLTAALALERRGAYDEAVADALVSGVVKGGGAVLEPLAWAEWGSVEWLVSYAFEERAGWFGRRYAPSPERRRTRVAHILRLISEAPTQLAVEIAGGMLYDRPRSQPLAAALGRLLSHPEPALRSAALFGLARHYPPPEAVRDDLARAQSDPVIGWKASVTLGRMDDARALPALLKALPERRKEVYIALRRMSAHAEVLMPAIRARLAAPADELETYELTQVLHEWEHPEEVPEHGWWLTY